MNIRVRLYYIHYPIRIIIVRPTASTQVVK